MHQFLNAIGFRNIKTRKELHEIIKQTINTPNEKKYIDTDRNSVIVEYLKLFTPSTGLVVRGEFDENNDLSLDYYYPVCKAYNVSSCEEITVERLASYESFAGILEDPRIGVSVIFDVQNNIDLMKNMSEDNVNTSVSISGMSINGVVMLPIKKNLSEKEKIEKNVSNRNKLLMAARNGDETAIESLTLDDMDTYALLSKKIRNEDVYSLVDSYFMPYGVECDQYSIMAEIEDYALEQNEYSGEEVYILTLNYNGIKINVSANKKDILGEPMAGRRFKGTVLIQGKINFS